MGNDKFYLSDGRVMGGGELTEMYRYNLDNDLLPVAGYFCPICFHEMRTVHNGVNCEWCRCKEEKINGYR